MAKKKPYDEVGVLRVLSKNRAVDISGKKISVDANQTSVGNGTWGKIDYLCKVCGYFYTIVRPEDKKANTKNYSPRIVGVNKINSGTTKSIGTGNAVPKIDMASMTRMAMKNTATGQ